MRNALAVATFGMSEIVGVVYKKLAQLDFITSARKQAISEINQEAINASIKNNPNVAKYNPNI